MPFGPGGTDLLFTSGQNVSFGRIDNSIVSPTKLSDDPITGLRLVFFEEHPQGGFTTVVQFDHAKSPARHMLLTNGKFEGNDDLKTQGFAQISFAAIPTQFASGFDRALQIGLGTGQSAHALVRLGFLQVDIAEYAPGVVQAAQRWFRNVNGGVVTEPHVKDRVNCVNALLRNIAGDHRLIIDPRCKQLIKDFEQVSWKKDPNGNYLTDLDKSDPMRTHASDALEYLVEVEFPMRRKAGERPGPAII
jgi:hypothetical protein